MHLLHFFDAVEADPDLEGLGVDEENDLLFVSSKKGPGYCTALSAQSIVENSWDLIKEVLHGDREPIVIHHMSRIVGYYSRVDNWNASKMAELRDRHLGKYKLEETLA